MPSLSELRAELAIDKTVLDDEVIRQPVLFYAISEAMTEAIAVRDAAKEELATIDAELDHTVRAKFASLEKYTEAMVKNGIQTSVKHQKAFTAYLDAKVAADKLEALKDAFKQRSYMLRDLVSLYSANYFEQSSLKPPAAVEASHYHANRARIATARANRSK